MSTLTSIFDSFKILAPKTKTSYYKLIAFSIINGLFELVPLFAIGLITYAINFQQKSSQWIEENVNIEVTNVLFFIIFLIFILSIIRLSFSLFYQKIQLNFYSKLETQITDDYLESYSNSNYATYLRFKFPHVINQANSNPRVLVVNLYTNFATLVSETFLLLLILTTIILYNYKITLVVFSINIFSSVFMFCTLAIPLLFFAYFVVRFWGCASIKGLILLISFIG